MRKFGRIITKALLPAEAMKLLGPHSIFMEYKFVIVFFYTNALRIVQCVCIYVSEINSSNNSFNKVSIIMQTHS